MLPRRRFPRTPSIEIDSAPSFLNCLSGALQQQANSSVPCKKRLPRERAAVCHVREEIGIVAVGPVHARERRDGMNRQGIHAQRAPCWLLAGVLGCHEPTCQRAGVISQRGFRIRPLTNHVSSLWRALKGRIPVPAGPLRCCFVPYTSHWRLLHCQAISVASKEVLQSRDGKGRPAPSGWLPAVFCSFFFGRCHFMKRTAGKYGAN